MKKFTKSVVSASVAAVMIGGATIAQAADSVNVAFFLEWATPNQISKVEKAYDDAMERARQRDAGRYMDYGFTRPANISNGTMIEQPTDSADKADQTESAQSEEGSAGAEPNAAETRSEPEPAAAASDDVVLNLPDYSLDL